jgi:putative flippase GtrA
MQLPAVLRQFTLYLGVGVVNTALGLGMILYLSEIAGMQYMLANLLGYIFGLCIGFILHKTITFKNKSTEFYKQFRTFTAVFCVSYLIQLGILFFMVDYLGFYNWAAQVLACGIYTVINYTGHRFATFKGQEPGA